MTETIKRTSIFNNLAPGAHNNLVAPAAQNNQVAPDAHNNQVAPDAHNNLVPSSATKDDEGDSAAGGEGDIDTQPCSRVYKRRLSRPFSGHRISQAIQRNRSVSSFDFPHSDLILTAVPDRIARLKSIDMSKVPWWTSQRFLLSILCFFGFVMMFAQRVNLSIAIVSMVDNDFLDSLVMNQSGLVTPVVDQCPAMETRDYLQGNFHWDKKTQGLILGAFFWGYILLQVFGGQVSEQFGATRVITGGMLPVAILSLLSPVCARANPYLFVTVRVFIGVGQSVMYPACQALWARWAPPHERSRLIGFSYAGGQFGNAIIFPIAGYLCAYGFDGGWPSAFYVPGAVGFLWCVLWIIFAADTPEQNRFISDIEKQYIQFSIGSRSTSIRKATPWKAMFTSRGMWAIMVAHMCGNYGAYMLLTQIPTYMKEVLKFDIKANGVYSMVPYLAFWLCITLACILADFLISRDTFSVGATRKIMTALGDKGGMAERVLCGSRPKLRRCHLFRRFGTGHDSNLGSSRRRHC
ncbi:sialin-like [Littorina saxatilis]|uniref:sialin-like n=1 Tax=Littorina saxatilis TaxID=31220 RepID=UPI0038B51A5C